MYEFKSNKNNLIALLIWNVLFFQKSKNLQECLKHAEYFVTILSDGLKGIECTLDKTAKIV